MKRTRKIIGIVISLMLVLIVSENIFAAVATVGATTHNATNNEPAYFKIKGQVVYDKLTSSQFRITNMRSYVWNYSTSGSDLTAPFFIVSDGVNVNHSTNTVPYYNLLNIPAGTSNYYTNVNWSSFLNTYYNGASNTYAVPATANDYSKILLTETGIYGGNYYDYGSIGYSYSAYWHGNGYVEILDTVANTPYWTSIQASTVYSAGNVIMEVGDTLRNEQVTEQTEYIHNMDIFETRRIYDQDTGITLIEFNYDGKDLPFVPDSAKLQVGEGLESIFSIVYFDDNGNIISGAITFEVPSTIDLSKEEGMEIFLNTELNNKQKQD